MWNILNTAIFIIECVLLVIGLICIIRKKELAGVVFFSSAVLAMNLVLYLVPVAYSVIVEGTRKGILFDVLKSFNCAVKMFAGDAKPELVAGYAEKFSNYSAIFEFGTFIAVFTTVSAVFAAFGRKVANALRVRSILRSKQCDIVVSENSDSLQYAKKNKNTIVLADDSKGKDYAHSLMKRGFPVIKGRLCADLLKSRRFNGKTRYNIIYFKNDEHFLEDIKMFISYLDSNYEAKNIRFYVEVDETIMETVQNKISAMGKQDDKKDSKTLFESCITLFSRNELVARVLVEENPITRYMPSEFIAEDTSVKPDKTINVFMLGFGALNREIYRQFIMNNQLAVKNDDGYHAFPINYYIYDEKVNAREWCIDGIKGELEKIENNPAEYFPVPDMPYNTKCINANPYFADFDGISSLADEASTLSYIFVDVGDPYRNIEMCDRLKKMIKSEAVHIFVRDEADVMCAENGCSAYGEFEFLLTHDVIVNEKLLGLAKSIDRVYYERYNNLDGKTAEEKNDLHDRAWHSLSYFDVYSNIYLAGNLRLKLNLLGLDYIKDGKGQNLDLLSEKYGLYSGMKYSDYFTAGKRNALLAQEHFRWNVYHLVNGYLPMEKNGVLVDFNVESGKVSVKNKNKAKKRHACITTYNGIDSLSEYIAQKANVVDRNNKNYTSEKFDYYINDELMFDDVAYRYLKDNNYSLITK